MKPTNFKYLLFGLVLVVAGFFASFSLSSAVSREEMIQSLMEQIKALQAQLIHLQNNPDTSSRWCYDFNHNLRIGDKGKEIIALHKALENDGLGHFDKGGDNFNDFEVFTEETASAVVGFQEKHKDEILIPNNLKYGTGFVGKSTRKKLNQLYGCEHKPISSSSSSNSSSSFNSSSLNSSSSNSSSSSSVVTTCDNGPKGMPIITSLSSYSGPVGTELEIHGCNFSGFENDMNAWIENSYGIKGILYGEWGSTSNFLKIILKDTLCQKESGLVCDAWMGLRPGAYKIYTKPWGKKSNEVNFTITAATNTPSITVISPNGGEELEKDANYPITWSAANLGNLTVSVDLVDSNGYITRNIVNNIKLDTANSGSYNWSVPQDLPKGSYKILVSSFDKGPSAQDYSDSYFTIK